jgi:hypothetical protein
MDSLVFNLRSASTTVQALAVTVGGLVGVFATLATFFLIIWISVKLGGKKA